MTFAQLGGRATLVTGAGAHPLADGIRADLSRRGVALTDAAAADPATPPVSSVFVTDGSGDRSVVSLNASGRSLPPPANLGALVTEAGIVLVDAHYRALALAAARAARAAGVPCILDGGSWRAGTPELLSLVDVAVCSADFRPPGTADPGPVLGYLLGCGVTWAAVTDGGRPVRWAGHGGHDGRGVRGEVAAVPVPVADTVGAGDVFHGAMAYALACRPGRGAAAGVPPAGGARAGRAAIGQEALCAALAFGARVAAHSCRFFGTREWMTSWPPR